MKKRNDELDILKGIAIILVVLGHAVNQVYASGNGESNALFRIIYSFHMPLFILTGGVICELTIRSDFSWCKHRITRIGIPYIAWLAIHYLIFCRESQISNFWVEMPYWYLAFILISDSLLFIAHRMKKYILVFTLFYVLNFLCRFNISDNYIILNEVFYNMPFYVAGVYLAKYRAVISSVLKSRIIAIGTILYAPSLLFYARGMDQAIEIFTILTGIENVNLLIKGCLFLYNRFLVPCLGICFAAWITGVISKHTKHLKNTLIFVGMNTMPVYLLHAELFCRPTTSLVINTMISFCIGLMVPILAANIIKRNRMISRLLFGA